MAKFYQSIFKGTKLGKTSYWGSNPMGVKEGSVLTMHIMLLQILRIYLESAPKGKQNWLAASSDPQMSKVFEAMHSHYQHSRSLESLPKVAGLSRSGFALSFKKKVGIAPLDYLTNWRMQIACNLLRTDGQTIASVASAVGYESESAFSVAFKRIIQCRAVSED